MKLRQIFFLPLLLLAVSGPLYAQGIIIPQPPRPCFECPPVPIPVPLPPALEVKSIRISTKIESQVATTKVEQVFLNGSPYRLQGTYFFPIPESASISEFAMYDGDKRMTAEVMSRDKARQIYSEIVRKVMDPALLEYAGKDLLSASIFPIEPRSEKRIELTYTQVLKSEGGGVSYRYPLGSGHRIWHLPPRVIPMDESAEPHARRGQKPIRSVSGSIEIASPVEIRNIYSPSHQISIKRDGEKRATLSFESSSETAQQDFQLFYGLSEREFGISLLTHREPGKPGYFLLLISPKLSLSERDRLAKDVVFVIDTSGSMSGEKIRQAKAALRFGLDTLGKDDRFNIINFSGEDHLLERNLLEASDFNRHRAVEFVDGLEASGGTNIAGALTTALRQFSPGDRPAILVFITDGEPTVGETSLQKILERVAEQRHSNLRLFTFGVGYDVNTQLLDQLSASSRGASDYIEPAENLETKVSNFFDKIHFPVLSDLRVDFGRVEADLVYPQELPDLFRGTQLTIIGRYGNAGDLRNAVLKLSGRMKGRDAVFEYGGQIFPESSSENRFLPRLWATRRVGVLMSEIRAHGENKELVDEIVALGTKYGIVTPYTSFLITADEVSAGRGPRWESAASPLFAADSAMAGPRLAQAPSAGDQAVLLHKTLRERREADRVAPSDHSNFRMARNKSFVLRDGVWTDTEFALGLTLPAVDLKFGSAEYFNAATEDSVLAEFLSVGQKVLVIHKGKIFKVID